MIEHFLIVNTSCSHTLCNCGFLLFKYFWEKTISWHTDMVKRTVERVRKNSNQSKSIAHQFEFYVCKSLFISACIWFIREILSHNINVLPCRLFVRFDHVAITVFSRSFFFSSRKQRDRCLFSYESASSRARNIVFFAVYLNFYWMAKFYCIRYYCWFL